MGAKPRRRALGMPSKNWVVRAVELEGDADILAGHPVDHRPIDLRRRARAEEERYPLDVANKVA